MRFNQIHLARCLDKVGDIVEQYRLYHLGADDPRRSVDNLRDTIQKYLVVKVRLLEAKVGGSVVQGMFVMLSEKEFEIVFIPGLDLSWKRFVICKELFHILLDQEQFRDMNILDHVEALTGSFPDDESKPPASVIAEFLAEIAAMEFLYPRERRLQELNNRTPYKEVAERYQVPLLFVERYMSTDWLQHLDPATINKA